MREDEGGSHGYGGRLCVPGLDAAVVAGRNESRMVREMAMSWLMV